MIKFEDYPEFKPNYTPTQMFEMGIFNGNYFNQSLQIQDYTTVVPALFLSSIHVNKLISLNPNKSKNFYKAEVSMDYIDWLEKGWIDGCDPYGWVNWYINFYYGRRIPEIDKKQIKRWKSFTARMGGMLKIYPNSNKIKQALLHWAY